MKWQYCIKFYVISLASDKISLSLWDQCRFYYYPTWHEVLECITSWLLTEHLLNKCRHWTKCLATVI